MIRLPPYILEFIVQTAPRPVTTPYLTYGLIALCVLAFIVQKSAPYETLSFGALQAVNEGFAPWQLLTYAFLHGDSSHLFFNMFGVYMFGSELERVFGPRRYLTLYFASVITAALAQLIYGVVSGSNTPMIGASGGLFGLLLAYAMVFPNRKLFLLFLPIPIPAWLFVTLYAGLELFLGVTGRMEGIAHFAHLGGVVGGFLVLSHWRASYQRRIRQTPD